MNLSKSRPDSGAFVSNSILPIFYMQSAEWITYSVYRIWHKQSNSSVSFIPTKDAQLLFPAIIDSTQELLVHTQSQPSHVALALLYTARLKMATPSTILLQKDSEYKILVTALLLAHKYHSDDKIVNKTWAFWAGIGILEMNQMEREFLKLLSGKLHIKSQEYQMWKMSMDILYQEFLVYKKVSSLDAKHSLTSNTCTPQETLRHCHTLKKSLKEPSNVLPRARTWEPKRH